MYSLYHSLLAQHPRQLTPVRCAASTIAQLHGYFEEVVLENSLEALVIEGLATTPHRSTREITRVRDLVAEAGNVFLFAGADDSIAQLMLNRGKSREQAVVLETTGDALLERFVVIADARFSAVLASVSDIAEENNNVGDLVVWTFEPDVVYSALEYLMARVTAEHPYQAPNFANAVRVSMPKATSLQLTLGVTTKLARLLQEQAEREIAVNRIATAIRNSLELDSLLETAANEVARALNVKYCAVQVEDDLIGQAMTKYCLRVPSEDVSEAERELISELDLVRVSLPLIPKTWVVDGDDSAGNEKCAQVAVPLTYNGKFVGFLFVQSDDMKRVWAENELLLLNTVADQLTVALSQAHLFAQTQRQALTDELTGCLNRRAFDMQLEHDLHMADRMQQPLSLIMIDLDNFKHINDQAGHDTGDLALRTVADSLRAELRVVDSAARFGGDEFAVILPQANTEGALLVAERLRNRIATTEVPGCGITSASFGVATFPSHASLRAGLVVAADRALYQSKNCGRNQVSVADSGAEANNEMADDTYPTLQLTEALHTN